MGWKRATFKHDGWAGSVLHLSTSDGLEAESGIREEVSVPDLAVLGGPVPGLDPTTPV